MTKPEDWIDTWSADADDPLGELPPDIREDVRSALNQIEASFRTLAELLGKRDAHERLSKFADANKPPPRRKRDHDAIYNARLLEAYIEAPKGQKMAAARVVAKAFKRPANDETLTRQIRRLQRRGVPDIYFPLDKPHLWSQLRGRHRDK